MAKKDLLLLVQRLIAKVITPRLRKKHKYLYRCKFVLIIDHKPLVLILGPSKMVPTLTTLIMQRWSLILQSYLYNIHHKKSEEHSDIDAMSRLPDPNKKQISMLLSIISWEASSKSY